MVDTIWFFRSLFLLSFLLISNTGFYVAFHMTKCCFNKTSTPNIFVCILIFCFIFRSPTTQQCHYKLYFCIAIMFHVWYIMYRNDDDFVLIKKPRKESETILNILTFCSFFRNFIWLT